MTVTITTGTTTTVTPQRKVLRKEVVTKEYDDDGNLVLHKIEREYKQGSRWVYDWSPNWYTAPDYSLYGLQWVDSSSG